MVASTKMQYRLADGLGRLTLDDGKSNVMQWAWCDELQRVLDEAERDDSPAPIG